MPDAIGHDDPEIRRQFGSESARLVYGRNPETGKLVYISKAKRGKACALACPHCKAALIANLKDDIKAAHFSHHGPACGGGPETAMHLLCKQIIQEELCLLIPAQVARYGDYETILAPDREIRLENVRMEERLGEIVPDLIAESSGHPLLVEIAVTHPCDVEKLRRLAKRGISAIEIDMSAVQRNAGPDEIRQAVLYGAPRVWLYSARIERGVSDLRRRSREETEEANRALTRQATEEIRIYQDHRSAVPRHALSGSQVAAMEAVGLLDILDLDVGGSGGFKVPGRIWKFEVLSSVLRHRQHYPFIGTDLILRHLLEVGMVHERFTLLSSDLVKRCASLDREFRSPWQAIHRFGQKLVAAGAAQQGGLRFALEQRVIRRWHDWEIAYRQKNDRIARVGALVDDILELVPEAYRGSLTREKWLSSIDPLTQVPMEVAIHDGRAIEGDLTAILDVLTLHSATLPTGLCGLPVARAMEEALPRKAAKEQAIVTRRAAEAAYDRRQTLILRSEKTLLEDDRQDWYRTPLADRGNLLPLDLAEQSGAGLAMAEKALDEFASARRIDRRKAGVRARLLDEAKRLFGDRADRIIRQPVDRKLSGLPPLTYCEDERTLREAIETLHWLARST